ncbi:MAG: aminotransferase class I/II-fold pyridoxal phosphate-dependent enzyme, partial [Burkholderiaceae bacterium]
MNPLLSRLQPYPFERLRQLFAGITPSPQHKAISLGIGEPRHATPPFILEALTRAFPALASYPLTAGSPELRQACVSWLHRRYGVTLDPATQLLPVNGSREALFSFAQTVVNPTASARPLVICPNPFYQIYEGAALLAGAQPYFVPSRAERNFAVDWRSVPDDVWADAPAVDKSITKVTSLRYLDEERTDIPEHLEIPQHPGWLMLDMMTACEFEPVRRPEIDYVNHFTSPDEWLS